MKRLLFGLILGLVAPASAGATTWYVAKTGSDSNSCTQAQSPSTPKSTINGGLACVGTGAGAGAGDTVQVASGTYAETISTWPSGTQGNPFTLKSATQYGAVIKPGAVSTQILYLNANYVTLDGLVVDGTNVTANNVWISATTGVTIQNSEIRNTKASAQCCVNSFQALYVYGASNVTIRNNRIHDIAVGATHFSSHGIYWSSANSLIEGNTIYNISGSGMQIYTEHGNSIDNNVVRNNRVSNFGSGGSANGIYTSGSNNVIYNNILYEPVYNSLSYGIMMKGSGNYSYNNTIYNNAVGLHIGGTGQVAQNNILWKNGISIDGTNYTLNHNLVNTDPQFVGLSTFNFHLQSTSPAVDAGLAISQVSTDADGVTRPRGSAFDYGAYEYSTTAAPTAPTNVHIVY